MLIQSLLCARVVFLRHFLFPYRGGRLKTLSYLHGKKINVKNVNVSHVNYAIMHVRKCKLYKYFFRKFQFYLKTEFIENEMEDLSINTIFFSNWDPRKRKMVLLVQNWNLIMKNHFGIGGNPQNYIS